MQKDQQKNPVLPNTKKTFRITQEALMKILELTPGFRVQLSPDTRHRGQHVFLVTSDGRKWLYYDRLNSCIYEESPGKVWICDDWKELFNEIIKQNVLPAG
jgi:hypothetical protein